MMEESPIRYFEFCAACGLMYDTHSVFIGKPYECPNCLRMSLADELYHAEIDRDGFEQERADLEVHLLDIEAQKDHYEETNEKLIEKIDQLGAEIYTLRNPDEPT